MKTTKLLLTILFVALSLLLSACINTISEETSVPNPAAVFCQTKGYTYQIRSEADGNQQEVCIFSEGNECEVWDFYNGACAPDLEDSEPLPTKTTAPDQIDDNPISINSYQDDEYRLALEYPSSWTLEVSSIGSANGNDQLSSRLLTFQKDNWLLSLHYKFSWDETVIGGGLGAGENVRDGSIVLFGNSVHVNKLIFEKKTKLVMYHAHCTDIEVYATIEDSSHKDYAQVEIYRAIQTEAEEILSSIVRTGDPFPTATPVSAISATPLPINNGSAGEDVNGWVGMVISAGDMPQVDDYFQMLDQNGSRYGIHPLDPDLNEDLVFYRDSGILIRVWGTLYRDRMDAYNTQIEVLRIEEYEG